MTHSLASAAPLPAPPLTPSKTRFSNIHTDTSFPVVLCVAPITRHNPTLNAFDVFTALLLAACDEEEKEEDAEPKAGVGEGEAVCNV
jgi:hypothetical protein